MEPVLLCRECVVYVRSGCWASDAWPGTRWFPKRTVAAGWERLHALADADLTPTHWVLDIGAGTFALPETQEGAGQALVSTDLARLTVRGQGAADTSLVGKGGEATWMFTFLESRDLTGERDRRAARRHGLTTCLNWRSPGPDGDPARQAVAAVDRHAGPGIAPVLLGQAQRLREHFAACVSARLPSPSTSVHPAPVPVTVSRWRSTNARVSSAWGLGTRGSSWINLRTSGGSPAPRKEELADYDSAGANAARSQELGEPGRSPPREVVNPGVGVDEDPPLSQAAREVRW